MMTPSAERYLRRFIAVAALFIAAHLLTAFTAAAPPNVIFFLTDDLGYADSHALGHPYVKTPHLDRLMREGGYFKGFYVSNPVCSPSRAAFMTGHYPVRHRVHQHFATPQQNAQRGMPNWLDPDVTMVPDLLKSAGYVTAHFGKWHLCGSGDDAPDPHTYGFDDYLVAGGSRNHDTWPASARNDPYFRAKSTGLFVDETIRFIKENKGKPFYVNLWTLVPHALLNPTPQELAVYDKLRVSPADFDSYMAAYVRDAKNPNEQMKTFCAALTGLDVALGKLLDFLDKEGLSENTIIVFSSDNGPEDYNVSNASNAGMGSSGVFRGRKRSLYEGGVRLPLVVRWPGKVQAGRVDDTSVLSAVDFLPTVCKLAGAGLPADYQADGEDVSDILLGESRPRKGALYWEWRGGVAGNQTYKPPALALRDGAWKLFMNAGGADVELYNIPADPQERKNVANEQSEVVAALKAKLAAWKKTLPK